VGLRSALRTEELVLYNPFLVRLHPSIDNPTHSNHGRVLGVMHRSEQWVIIDLEVVNLEESQRVRHARHAPPFSTQASDRQLTYLYLFPGRWGSWRLIA
jgi:hypothetical protein